MSFRFLIAIGFLIVAVGALLLGRDSLKAARPVPMATEQPSKATGKINLTLETGEQSAQSMRDVGSISEWWCQPTYSSYRYDPSLAGDSSYRELVHRHLLLKGFYESPARYEAAFEELVQLVGQWGLDPEHNLELVIHAHNIAYEHQGWLRHFRRSTGNLASPEEREFQASRLAFNIENLQDRFEFLFEEYPNAEFEGLLKIQPDSGIRALPPKIQPGTPLISK